MISTNLDPAMKKAGEILIHDILPFHIHAYVTLSSICFTSLGVEIVSQAVVKEVTKEADGTITLHLEDGRVRINYTRSYWLLCLLLHVLFTQTFGGFDKVLSAIGREPLTAPLALAAAGVKTGPAGHIEVDDYQNTSTEGVYALGDVCGKVELTPMAIAAGRRLADRYIQY